MRKPRVGALDVFAAVVTAGLVAGVADRLAPAVDRGLATAVRALTG